MGWITEYTPRDKSAVVKELVKDAIDHRVVGNHVWALWKLALRDDLCIDLHLLCLRKGCWSSKSMGESVGPCYYTCPLSFLERSALNGEIAQKWAGQVREYHAYKKLERAGTIEVGKTYQLLYGYRDDPAAKIKIQFHCQALSWAALYPCGGVYRVTKQKIDWRVPCE